MVKIRLARHGRKKRPWFTIVATKSSSRRDGRFIEKLGYYDPLAKIFKVDDTRVAYWVSVGAQLSPTVVGLLTKYNVKAN